MTDCHNRNLVNHGNSYRKMASTSSLTSLVEYDDLESMLLLPRNTWVHKAKINTYCRWSLITEICDVLRKVKEMQDFEDTCFAEYCRIETKVYFPSSTFHELMLRRINEPNASPDELWFAIGRTKARLSAREFCLVTGLKLGDISDICKSNLSMVEGGIHHRYWDGREIAQYDIEKILKDGKFQQRGDALKMALVLFVNNILFGQDYRKTVDNWILVLVEDLATWNSFSWGSYVWKLTLQYLHLGFRASAQVANANDQNNKKIQYDVYGFVWGVMFWACEAIPSLAPIIGECVKCSAFPCALRWSLNRKPSRVQETISGLEQSGKFQAYETIQPTLDKVQKAYYVDTTMPISHEAFPFGMGGVGDTTRILKKRTVSIREHARKKQKTARTTRPLSPQLLSSPRSSQSWSSRSLSPQRLLSPSQSPPPPRPPPPLHHDAILRRMEDCMTTMLDRLDALERRMGMMENRIVEKLEGFTRLEARPTVSTTQLDPSNTTTATTEVVDTRLDSTKATTTIDAKPEARDITIAITTALERRIDVMENHIVDKLEGLACPEVRSTDLTAPLDPNNTTTVDTTIATKPEVRDITIAITAALERRMDVMENRVVEKLEGLSRPEVRPTASTAQLDPSNATTVTTKVVDT